MLRDNEVKSYKWIKLEDNPPKNSVLYVLDPETHEVELFVTDRNGNPKPVKTNSSTVVSDINIKDYITIGTNNAIEVRDNQLFVKKYISNSPYISIVESENRYELVFNDGNIEINNNKQDSLLVDGTGTKYPTVDAVNEIVQVLRTEISTTTSDKNFTYEQIQPSSIWDFEHTLDKKPTPIFVDTAGTQMVGKVTINNGRRMKIEFNAPVNGFAILN